MQPVTRWVSPHPFAETPAPRSPRAAKTRSDMPIVMPSASVAIDSMNRLAALLVEDLTKGHRYKAIRHFLMLRACGGQLSASTQHRCEQFLLDCPRSRRRRIAGDVERWVEMLVKPYEPRSPSAVC